LFFCAGCGERNRLDYKLDYYALMLGAICPVLLWHASPTRRFDWFVNGETFLFRVPKILVPFVLTIYVGCGFAWVIRQFYVMYFGDTKTGTVGFNHGKWLVMCLSWLTWYLGALIDHAVVALAFLNLFHGIPFFVIVYQVSQARFGAANASGNDAGVCVFLVFFFFSCFWRKGHMFGGNEE